MDANDVMSFARSNPINLALLGRLPQLGLNDCYLTAGCVFQAIWNHVSGRRPEWGIKDYDVFYFDDTDLSWDAEAAVIDAVSNLTRDLGVVVEVRNQARVHLWYEKRFGAAYPQLTCTQDGINRYLVSCTCVGIEVVTGRLYAPNGLIDLAEGILRENPAAPKPNRFIHKAQEYRSRWPWLTIPAT